MQFYITENFEIFKIGDIVYDNLDSYKIIKFIVHHKRKNYNDIYLCVNLQNLSKKSVKFTVPVDLLTTHYKRD